MKLREAVRIVNAAVAAEEKRLQEIAEKTGQDSILLEGETEVGCYARLMADPSMVAKVMLDYGYPMYRVLDAEAPQGMWDELARMTGLASVFAADI